MNRKGKRVRNMMRIMQCERAGRREEVEVG
jgi:hypothetical protein